MKLGWEAQVRDLSSKVKYRYTTSIDSEEGVQVALIRL